MCGLVGVWAKEAYVSSEIVDQMFKANSRRGNDGWGYVLYDTEKRKIVNIYKTSQSYNDDTMKAPCVGKGQLLIGICRAKPETEVETRLENLDTTMQPIVRNNRVVVHNGALNTYYDDIYKSMTTQIDSEAILIQYEKYDHPEFVNHLIGGFAFMLIDPDKNVLNIGVNHMPLYHGYVRTVGYFISSVKDVISDVIKHYYRAEYDSMNVWESWYHTLITAFTVRQIDLESGCSQFFKFKPRYLLPGREELV